MGQPDPSQLGITLDYEAIATLVRQGKIQPPRRLTAAELVRCASDKAQRPTRFDTKSKTQAAVHRFLASHLHAKLMTVHDRPMPIRDKDTGGVRYVYPKRGDVDLTGSVPLLLHDRVSTFSLHVEVKGITSGTFPLKNLSLTERDYLEKARRQGHAAWVCLGWWVCLNTCGTCGYQDDRPKLAHCPHCGNPQLSSSRSLDLLHLVRYRDWSELETALRDRAGSGFQGQSIRPVDHDLLESCAVRKQKGRWVLSQTHWLHPFIPSPSQSVDEIPL